MTVYFTIGWALSVISLVILYIEREELAKHATDGIDMAAILTILFFAGVTLWPILTIYIIIRSIFGGKK